MTPRMDPIKDASAWTGDDLKRDQSWEFNLTSLQKSDLDSALQQVKNCGLSLAEITQADFPLPTWGDTLQSMLDEIRGGRGLALLHGLPTEGYELDDLEKLYWGLCTHLGIGVTP